MEKLFSPKISNVLIQFMCLVVVAVNIFSYLRLQLLQQYPRVWAWQPLQVYVSLSGLFSVAHESVSVVTLPPSASDLFSVLRQCALLPPAVSL